MSHRAGHGEDGAGTDDLTRIAGIGAKTAERLNAAGIRNYPDLASRSASDIVGLLPDVAGLSPARLNSWRDQARELAAARAAEPAHPVQENSVPASSVPASSASEDSASEDSASEDSASGDSGLDGSGDAPNDGQHYESFVVRVLLNEDGSIRRTTAQHVGTGVERHWPGLAREALPGFIEAAVSPAVRPAQGPAEQRSDAAHRPTAAAAAMSPRLGELRRASAPTSRVEAQHVKLTSSAGLSLERTVLRAAEPFTMTMTIDLAGPSLGADRLAYSAVIVAKPMAGGPKRTVAQADGLFATRSPTISIDAAGLPSGAYRLDAAVSLREPRGGHLLGLAAMAEGLLVHVLPG